MNSINSKDKGQGPIRVADVTLAQLSRGLYRSTATAFKELASNAYDADATVVRIDTNFPEFDFISCVDNGTGMPLEDFLRYFSMEGIGSCNKRKNRKDKTDIYKRPIIGRLGIGMLAIGQICHSFEIESHYEKNGNGQAYKAKIILLDPPTIPDKEDIIQNEDLETKDMQVGTWRYEIIDYDNTKKGFRIYSSDVRKTFKISMKSGISEKEQEKISFSLSELHSEFYDKRKKSIRECKPYLETIWELAILCPLPYYGEKEKYPIKLSTFAQDESKSNEYQQAIQFIQNRQQKFLNENFSVVYDGIGLQRHIQLPTEDGVIPKLFFINFNEKVFDKTLKFSGYLFAQISNAVKPLELNGVQIRLRGVGIGGYDSTFLKYYKQIETIRNKWVSGEIFVDEGLEEALNIDRDSFNEHDEHFKKLQSVLHEKLDDVFNKTDLISRERQEKRREIKDEEIKKSMQQIVTKQSEGKFKFLQQDLDKKFPIVFVNKDKGEIILNTAARPLKKKKANMFVGAVELAYQIAKHTAEKDEEKRDKLFSKLVKEIFDGLL